MNKKHCYICGNEADIKDATKNSTAATKKFVTCKKCGEYQIGDRDSILLQNDEDKYKKECLSVMIRRHCELNKSQLFLHKGNYEELVNQYDSYEIDEKCDNFIYYLGERTKPGERIDILPCYFSLPTASKDEFDFIIKYLMESELIEQNANRPGEKPINLTVKGWKYLQEIMYNKSSRNCFIAMTFTDDKVNKEYEESVSPVLKELGFEPIIVNKIQHNKDSVDRIKWGIKISRFVIADTRGLKQNVFYEAGYAMGLKKEVIWLCKNGEESKLPFDTRNLNHIIWETVEDLKINLEDRIKGSILI